MVNKPTGLFKTKPHFLLLGTILILVTIFLYHPALKYYFFRDDFYLLAKSQATNLKDFIRFFIPGSEIYYRPLSMRIYFFLMQKAFAAEPLHFHMVSLLVHILNSLLIAKLISKLTNNTWIGWLSAFLYSTSSIHFISLFWISEIGLLLGIFFYLLSCIKFLSKKPSIAFIFFILGLLSHEYVVTLPLILLAITIYKNPKQLKKTLPALSPFYLISLIYLIFRLFIFPLSATGTYAITFGKQTLKALVWYLAWSLNIPEEIKNQFGPNMVLNQAFLHQFPQLNLSALVQIILAAIFLVGLPFLFYTQANKATKKKIDKIILFSAIWIAATISIPLLTPYHLYPMYMSLPLISIALLISVILWLLYPSKNKMIVATLITWLLFSWQTLRFTEGNHWVIREAGRVKDAFAKASQLYPSLPKGSTIVIQDSHKIDKQELFDQYGMQFAYNDYSLKTYYGNKAAIIPPACKIESKPDKCLTENNIFILY